MEMVALTARYERILFFPHGEVISVSSLTAYIYRKSNASSFERKKNDHFVMTWAESHLLLC